MLDLELLPSAATKKAHTTDRVDNRATRSPAVAELPQDASTRFAGNLAHAFTVSSFGSGSPLTLPDSAGSGRQALNQSQPCSAVGSNSQHSSAAPHQNLSFNGSVSASAERRQLNSTSAPSIRPRTSEVTSNQNLRGRNASCSTHEPSHPQHVKAMRKTSTAATTAGAATSSVRPTPPALTSFAGISMPISAADERQLGFTRSTTPMSPPIFVNTASMPNPAAASIISQTGSSALSVNGSTPSWVDYEAYVRLSSALLPQRALQERVAQLCCASMPSADGQARLICLDNVFAFLLYGGAVTPPTTTAVQPSFEAGSSLAACSTAPGAPTAVADQPSLASISSSPAFVSDEAQRMCFPLFCLIGAKMCALAEHSRAIRSIHTAATPMSLALALRPQAAHQGAGVSGTRKNGGRSHILLLFSEQLTHAFPDFPTDLLYTTSPSGLVVTAPPSEVMPFWHSWQTTPREARQNMSFESLWSVITLQRLAVLLERWGVSPAAAMQKWHTTAASSTTTTVNLPHPPEGGGASRPAAAASPLQQLLLPTTSSYSHLSLHTPQHAADGRGAEAVVAPLPKTMSPPAAPTPTNSSPTSHNARAQPPYPRSARPQHSKDSNHSLSVSGTVTSNSSNNWDLVASLKAVAPTRNDFTPATAVAAAVRLSAARSRCPRHEAALTSLSSGTPLAPDGADLRGDDSAEEGEGGHPYNAFPAADSKAALNCGGRSPYGQLHKYDVPSPPRPSPSTTAFDDGSALFLRSLARSGPVASVAAGGGTTMYGWWTAKAGRSSSMYVPSPPKTEPVQQQQRHPHPSTAASFSTHTERLRSDGAFTLLPLRAMTAETCRGSTALASKSDPALYPYNVVEIAHKASKKHKRSHKHSGSTTRHHHRRHHKKDADRTAAVAEEADVEQSKQASAASDVSTTEMPGLSSSCGRDASGGRDAGDDGVTAPSGTRPENHRNAWTARQRTEQVNAYVQSLLSAAAAAASAQKQDEAHGDEERLCSNANSVSMGSFGGLCGDCHAELNGAVTSPATTTPLDCDLHVHSYRSNTSVNANSLNGGGRQIKNAGDGGVGIASHALSNATLELANGASQPVSTGVQYVPAPPPSKSLSHSPRSNPHTSILQSWENSMTSQSDSGWRGVVTSAAALPHPSQPSPLQQRQSGEGGGHANDGAALIPSTASSQSQLTISSPRDEGGTVQQEQRHPLHDPQPAQHARHEQHAGMASELPATVCGTAQESGCPASPPQSPSKTVSLCSAMPNTELLRTLDGVGSTDKAVLVVSHTPEHGLVVTRLQLSATATAHPTGCTVEGALLSECVAGKVLYADGAPSPSSDSPPSPMVKEEEEEEACLALRPAPAHVAAVPVVVKAVVPSVSVPSRPQQKQQKLQKRDGKAVPTLPDDSPLSEPAGLEADSQPASTANGSGEHTERVSPDVAPPARAASQAQARTPLPHMTSETQSGSVPRCQSIAAQLRGLIAPALQAVGRGYFARRELGIKATLQKMHTRNARFHDDAFIKHDISPSTSAHPYPATPGPDAVAIAVVASQSLPSAVVVPATAGSSSNTAAFPSSCASGGGGGGGVALAPSTPILLLPATVTESKPPRKTYPPPLTAFTAPESPAALRSPVMHGSLRVAGASASASAGEARTNESSCLGAAKSSSLKDAHYASERGLNRSSSQSSATSSQHPSNFSPAQRLFAIYGAPDNFVMENSSSSWTPLIAGQSAVTAVYATPHNESGLLESKLLRSVRAGEQSLDASHFSSVSVPWAKDGGRGNRDGMMSTHTLPPPRENGSSGSGSGYGDGEGSTSRRSKRKDGSHSMISAVLLPTTDGVVEALVPSLMKPIMISSCDRLSEDASSPVLRDSTEDWLNLLHSRLGGGGSCTVAFSDQTANGPSNGSMESNSQDTATSRSRPGLDKRRHSNSLGSAWAMISATYVLRLQRIGRGYLMRLQLAQRYRDVREEKHLDAVLRDVLRRGSPLTRPLAIPAVAAEAAAAVAAAAQSAATVVKPPETTAVATEAGSNDPGRSGEANKGNASTGESGAHLPNAATGLTSGISSRTPSPQLPAVSATPQGPLDANGAVLSSPPSPLSAAFFAPPSSPFQVPSEGCVPSTQSSGSAFVAEGPHEHASLLASSTSVSKSGNGAAAVAASAASVPATDSGSSRFRYNSPFVTPDNLRYLVPPALQAARRSSQSLEIAQSNSLSLSKEALGYGVSGSAATANVATAFGNALLNNNADANGAAACSAGPATPSLPPSASRRRGAVSPPSMWVSFSRDSYSPTLKHGEPEFPAAVAANTPGGPAATEAPPANNPRAKMVEGVNRPSTGHRSPPPSDPEAARAVEGAVTAAVAVASAGSGKDPLPPAVTTTTMAAAAAEEPPRDSKTSRDGAVQSVPSEPIEVVSQPQQPQQPQLAAGPTPTWRTTSAAAGASVSPLEGSLFAASGHSGRSMVSTNSLPFEFSTTAHAVSAMSQAELMFSGRTMGSMTPAQWTLGGVEMVDSTSHFDDMESVSEGNEDSRGGSDDDEEAEAGNSSDEDVSEADVFKKDISHVEEGGAEPACFGAAAHLLRGEAALITKDGALSLLQRVGRGYLCRRHQHFLFMVSISFAEVALLQRVAVAYLARRKMGLEFQVNRLAKEEMAYWELRNRSAIKLHAVVRGFIARQRVKRLQRKLFTRVELRTALELPDPDE